MYQPDPQSLLDELSTVLLSPSAAPLCDATLRTKEGSLVPVCRALLSIRSPYFSALLIPPPTPPPHIHPVPFLETPLRQLLQFAYTGRSSILEELQRNVAPQANSQDPPDRMLRAADVSALIDVTAAAQLSGMDALLGWCNDLVKNMAVRYSSIVCMVLEEVARKRADTALRGVGGCLREVLRESPRNCFRVPDCVLSVSGKRHVRDKAGDAFGVLLLSASTLRAALGAEFLDIDQEYLFQVVYYWATNGQMLEKKGDKAGRRAVKKRRGEAGIKRETMGETEVVLKVDAERWRAAKQMTELLELRSMRSVFLRDYVKDSGLVGPERLIDVLLHLATKNAEDVVSCEDVVIDQTE